MTLTSTLEQTIQALSATIRSLQEDLKALRLENHQLRELKKSPPPKTARLPDSDSESDGQPPRKTPKNANDQVESDMEQEEFPPLRPIAESPLKSTLPSLAIKAPMAKKSAPVGTPKFEKPPPIVLRKPEIWPKVAKDLKSQGISVLSAKSQRLGIQIHPATPQDHRKITRHFNTEHIPWHSYFLEEEKCLNIIIRGLNMAINIEEVQEELLNMGFHPKECYRLKLGHNKRPCPLIKLLLPKAENSIFQIESILDLPVKIESQNPTNKSHTRQCHNCQQFGHSQSNCHAQSICHKCAGEHHHTTCTKDRQLPPKCANCGGAHPASDSRCPKNPSNFRKSTLSPAKTFTKNTSFAVMAKATQMPAKTTAPKQTPQTKAPATEEAPTLPKNPEPPCLQNLVPAIVNAVMSALASTFPQLSIQ